MPTPITRSAAQVANSVAFLQFAWGHPLIQAMMERAGVQSAVGYFPVRLAPVGDVPPVVAQSLMPFFPEPLVAKMVAKARGSMTAEALRDLVHDAMTEAANTVYGAWGGTEELSELLGTAAGACELDGRPLTAAWTSYEWEGPAARMFGAATVLREHRGEGHWFAVAAAGVSGAEAHILSQLRAGHPRGAVSHGFRPNQVEAIIAKLEARGWVVDDVVTEAGKQFQAAVETATDDLDAAPWRAIGESGVLRVIELGASVPSPNA